MDFRRKLEFWGEWSIDEVNRNLGWKKWTAWDHERSELGMKESPRSCDYLLRIYLSQLLWIVFSNGKVPCKNGRWRLQKSSGSHHWVNPNGKASADASAVGCQRFMCVMVSSHRCYSMIQHISTQLENVGNHICMYYINICISLIWIWIYTTQFVLGLSLNNLYSQGVALTHIICFLLCDTLHRKLHHIVHSWTWTT